MRWRIALGTMILAGGLGAYALAVGLLAPSLVSDSPIAGMTLYAFAGLIWVWPAARVTRWMQAGDRDAGSGR